MKNHTSQKLLFISLAIVFITLLSSITINLLTGSEDIKKWLEANGVGTTKLIVGTIIISATLSLLTYLQIRRSQFPGPTTENFEADVKRLFDSLKERYQNRYQSKLDRRFEITLEVSENWNSDKPKTYKFGAGSKISYAVDAIRKAFDEKGRLLIVGSPGSGKTVLLLKLALELLGNEFKEGQRLPVIFNLASWWEKHIKFEDWLIDVLNSGNGLSKDFARTLLQENRIIFLLDGLDELARNEETTTASARRAMCLDSIYKYAEVGHKYVICCRREEFVKMQKSKVHDELLPAKVEVLDLTGLDIEVALAVAQRDGVNSASAAFLESVIKTHEAFSDVLSTPFYFTTALEVFDKTSLKELVEKVFPEDIKEIKPYLLDKFIETKISHSVKLTNFERDETKIRKWLQWLARLMEKKQLVTFELVDLQSSELIPERFSKLIIALFIGFFFSLWFSLWRGLLFCLYFGIWDVRFCYEIGYKIFSKCGYLLLFQVAHWGFHGFLQGLLIGFFYGVASSFFKGVSIIDTSIEYPDRAGFFQALKTAYRLFGGWLLRLLTIGAIAGILLSFWNGLLPGLLLGLILALAAHVNYFYDHVLTAIYVSNEVHGTDRVRYFQHPYQKMNSSLFLSLILSSSLIFIFIFLGLILAFINFNYVETLETVLFMGLFWGAMIGRRIQIRLYDHVILRLCLYLEGAMPLRYATFLEYAAEARILEKDGGQWRFRHQNLQEHFANLDAHY